MGYHTATRQRTTASLSVGIGHSIRYRVRRRDLVCFQFRAARWRCVLGLRRQPSATMWRRKPKVAATGVIVGLMEWVAMEALRPYIPQNHDVLGTVVDIKHRRPAFRGDALYLTALCTSTENAATLWHVNTYRGSQLVAQGYVGFQMVHTELIIQRWAPTSAWRRTRLRPRWCHRVAVALHLTGDF
jgi:predicted thioesterase